MLIIASIGGMVKNTANGLYARSKKNTAPKNSNRRKIGGCCF
ncbi:MAG: hypothetical protein Q8Q40_11365 [Methylococcaceae bacterium]|nr:hypothetical protein [Methylococcaceae bacterium]MDP3904559.1 hypothetical protein [Methylococcaceae bacterium]